MLESYISNQYLRALTVFVLVFLITRIALVFIKKISLKFSSKTKTSIDDELVAKLEMPLTIIAFLVSLLVTLPELTLSDGVNEFALNIIYSAFVIIGAYLIYVVTNLIVITALRRFAKKTKSKIDDTIISLFHSVLDIALVIISLLYVLALWGVEITPLLAGLGIAGLAIALALQPVLSNIFSGASLILDHTIRVGDLVYLDANTKGKIDRIGLRSTKIRTFDNEFLIVPNNKLAESVVQNVALPEPKSRVVVPFSVAYGSDIDKVKKIIYDEIKKIKIISQDSDPIVRFIEMNTSSLDFKAYFYVDSYENRFPAIDEANTRIYNILRKNNIGIPFPQLDVHLKKD